MKQLNLKQIKKTSEHVIIDNQKIYKSDMDTLHNQIEIAKFLMAVSGMKEPNHLQFVTKPEWRAASQSMPTFCKEQLITALSHYLPTNAIRRLANDLGLRNYFDSNILIITSNRPEKSEREKAMKQLITEYQITPADQKEYAGLAYKYKNEKSK